LRSLGGGTASINPFFVSLLFARGRQCYAERAARSTTHFWFAIGTYIGLFQYIKSVLEVPTCMPLWRPTCIHRKNVLWRVFHILTGRVPYKFVSVNRRNNEVRAHIAMWIYGYFFYYVCHFLVDFIPCDDDGSLASFVYSSYRCICAPFLVKSLTYVSELFDRKKT